MKRKEKLNEKNNKIVVESTPKLASNYFSELYDDLEKLQKMTAKERIEFDADRIQLDFVHIILQYMERRNVTKKELAKKLKVSQKFLSDIFSSDERMDFVLLGRIYKVLDITYNMKMKD